MTSKANFLLLDEPTNHLDIHSNELLIEALNKYQGSLILVSHDRYFIAKTANKIWEIVDKKIRVFKGTYEEWVDWKQRMEQREKDQAKENAKSAAVKKEVKEVSPEPQKKQQKVPTQDIQKQQKLFNQIEKELAGLNEQRL
jgi:ATP-binding cassette subfamily F protein 3